MATLATYSARILLAGAVAAVIATCAVLAIGRAADVQTRDYVTFTRDGITVSCERRADSAGRVYFGPCDRVSP